MPSHFLNIAAQARVMLGGNHGPQHRHLVSCGGGVCVPNTIVGSPDAAGHVVQDGHRLLVQAPAASLPLGNGVAPKPANRLADTTEPTGWRRLEAVNKKKCECE